MIGGMEKSNNRTPPPGVDPTLYCSVCDLVSEDRVAAEEHLKTHRPFACDFCEKRFSQKCNLVTHQRLHTGEKPYICDVCQKRFTQKGNLDAHIKTHTKEKPYPCSLCTKRFAFKSSLQTHLRNHEEGRLGPEDVDEDDVETIKVHARMQHIAMGGGLDGSQLGGGYSDTSSSCSQEFVPAAIHAEVNGRRLPIGDDSEEMDEEEDNSNLCSTDEKDEVTSQASETGVNGESEVAKMSHLVGAAPNFGSSDLHHRPQLAVGHHHHMLEVAAEADGDKDGPPSTDMPNKMVLGDGRQTIAMQ